MSTDNLIVDWWEGGLKVIAGVLEKSYQRDWMDAANCQVASHDDKSFITKPDAQTAKRWERICKQCPVSMQCMEWADKDNATGVFIAGEWRE